MKGINKRRRTNTRGRRKRRHNRKRPDVPLKPKEMNSRDIAINALKSDKMGRRAVGSHVVERLKDRVIISPNMHLSSHNWPQKLFRLEILVFPELKHMKVFEEAGTRTASGGPSDFNLGAVLTSHIDYVSNEIWWETCQYHYNMINPSSKAKGGYSGLPIKLHKKYAGARRDTFKHLLTTAKELKVPLIVKNTALRENEVFEREITDICRKNNVKIEKTQDGLRIIPPGKRKVKPRWESL